MENKLFCYLLNLLAFMLLIVFSVSCSNSYNKSVRIEDGNIYLKYDNQLQSEVFFF